MKEEFLHFVWKHQYFNKTKLRTVDEQLINILRPGTTNLESGPDFSNASIKIGDLAWKGNIEIHVRSSSWNQHKHQRDPAYNNVVLHVVWENDKEIFREDGSSVPTIEIKERIDKKLMEKSSSLSNSILEIPCQNSLKSVDIIVKVSMIEKALVERLKRKGESILETLGASRNDWELTTIKWLIRNYGFKVNEKPFDQLSEKISTQIIRQNTGSQFRLEAILFGQAGFLNGRPKDEYQQKLKDEFTYMQRKYRIAKAALTEVSWKFGGLRPQNFPTVRISQLAATLYSLKKPFSELSNPRSYDSLRALLTSPTSSYWKTHFRFGQVASRASTTLGASSLDILIINVVVPLLSAYSVYTGNEEYMERAISFLGKIKAESNRKIKRWSLLGISPLSAADSQGLIEMFDSYCTKKLCLSCNIGTSIVVPTGK